jgi:hypothetical protein
MQCTKITKKNLTTDYTDVTDIKKEIRQDNGIDKMEKSVQREIGEIR